MSPPLSPRRADHPHMRLVVSGSDARTSLPTDDELVQAIIDGDARVASHVYVRLAPCLRRVLRRLSASNPSDLDDLIQLAFEQVLTSIKRGGFRAGADLETWAAVIASRVGMSHLRTVYRRRRFFVFDSPVEASTGPIRPETSLQLQEVLRALAGFKEEHAQVVFLHDALGYELREIADELGITVSAAQSRLVRTRKELSRCAAAGQGGRK